MAEADTIGSESLLDKIKHIPRDFAHAVSNNTKYFLKDVLGNKRLWAGLAASLFLHGLIFLLPFATGLKKEPEQAYDIPVAYDPSLPPKAQQLVQKESQFVPGGYVEEQSAAIDLTKGKVSFQSELDVKYSLEKGQVSLAGDVIRINPNARLSTEEILAQAPINIERSYGGTGAQDPFDKIAAGAGTSYDLDTRATRLGEGVEEPSFETQRGGLETTVVEEELFIAKKEGSSYSIIGDLSESDIINFCMPSYPPWARQKGLTNVTISISFSANRYGNVNPTVIVAKSTGYPSWDNIVKEALKRSKFDEDTLLMKRNAMVTYRFVLRSK